ncbi:Uncharacterised protein [uncultured Clostridium sp.]|uniref:hypothetical protein n=1 Tax=uncultured Clostridium sp. TaxID=59620 RepID=UPI000822BA95|nr:hypothetical protein [uncultured Clostridium sp.]SCJ56680.1 Uncharacterised protein [uncultured Clostridium sp.]
MKLKNLEVLCTKIEAKTNKDGGNYLLIDLLDIASGDNFNIMSKNIEFMSKLKAMTKYIVTLNLTSSRYGLRLDLEEVGEDLGSI